MKQFLNNPKYVIPLAAMAIGTAAFNVLQPLAGGTGFADTSLIPSIAEPGNMGLLVSEDLTGMPRGENKELMQEMQKIGWDKSPARDPFRLNSELEMTSKGHAAKPLAAAEETGSSSQDAPSDVREQTVDALVIGPSFRLAVVDGQLVKEGNSLLRAEISAKVSTISPGAVELIDHNGSPQTLPAPSSMAEGK